MDKKVVWMPQTIEDLNSIAEYISRDSEYYASVFIEEIIDAGETLSSFYNRGRIVPERNDKSIREIFIGEYRLIYQITSSGISILTVIHGRRKLGKTLSKKK